MLSVVPIKSSSVKANYYLKQDGGYYIEKSNNGDLYQWFGKGSEKLGLKGEVTTEQFLKIFSGELPNGQFVGKESDDGKISGRPGYDLTFSMTKDLSLIISCTDNSQLRDFLLNSHFAAVRTAMTEVEKCVQARVTRHGITSYENTKNIVAGLFTHFSSRAGDPQIHTHACVANVTERSDGKWRALATDLTRKHGFFELIRDQAVYFGTIYQNEMACAARKIGFDLESVHKNAMFHIAGMPVEIRDHFSKRAKTIREIVGQMGPDAYGDKTLIDWVAQHSKPNKKSINENFFDQARKNMSQFIEHASISYSFDTIVSRCLNTKGNEKDQYNHKARDAISDATEYLSKYKTTFDSYSVLKKAIDFDLGNSSHESLNKALLSFISDGTLLLNNKNLLTSNNLVIAENRLIESAEKTFVKSCLEKDCSSLSLLQRIHANHEKSRLCIVSEPRSMEDKSKFIGDLVGELESKYRHVKLLTPSKTLSLEYNAERRENQSLFQRLKNIGKEDLAESFTGFINQYATVQSSLFSNIFRRQGDTVFVIDQADHISRDNIQKIIDLSEKSAAKIIFLKSYARQENVVSSTPLGLLQRAGIITINSNKYSEYNRKKIKEKKLFEIKEVDRFAHDKQKARHIECAKYIRTPECNKNTMVLSFSKASCEKLNHTIHKNMKDAGILGDSIDINTPERVYLADQEKKHAKFYPLGGFIKTYIGNGQYEKEKIVRHDLQLNKVVLQNERGKFKEVTPREIADKIDKKGSQIYVEKKIELSVGDKCRFIHENTQLKLLGLKANSTYIVSAVDKNTITFCSDKTKRVKLSKLENHSLNYDYARTVNEAMSLRSVEKIVAELPHYALNENLMHELSRRTEHLVLITDDKKKAEKFLEKGLHKEAAIDQIPGKDSHQGFSPKSAIQYAINVVSAREAAFTADAIMKEAMNLSVGRYSQKDLVSEFKKFVDNGELLSKDRIMGEPILTTPEALKIESLLVDQIKNGKNSLEPYLSADQANSFLKNIRENSQINLKLTYGQEEACKLIATTRDRFVMIQGYAGTGKSTMLETLVGSATKKRNDSDQVGPRMLPTDTKVIALAPTHQAVHELIEKGVQAQTLKSFLVDHKETTVSGTQKNVLKDVLVIVDESSMISNKDFFELQKLIEDNGARCAYIGDIAQLTAVEAGKPSELVFLAKEANMATAVMDEHIRQKNPYLKQIAGLMMECGVKNFTEAWEKSEQYGFVVEASKNGDTPISMLKNHYLGLSPAERQNTLIAVASNKDRNDVNHVIREALIKEGSISKNSIQATILVDSRLTNAELCQAKHFTPGDVVKYKQNYQEVSGRNIDSNTITLEDNQKKQTVLPLSNLASNTILELHKKKNIEFSVGDQLKFTKTNRERGWFANTPLIVEEIDRSNNTMVVRDRNNRSQTLLLNEREAQHLDYNYCSTTHGLQGATSDRVLFFLNSHNKKLNTMRLLYVGMTRAREQAFLFTDNAPKVKQQILRNAGEKTSALQAMGLLDLKKHDTTTSQKVEKKERAGVRIDAVALENSLRMDVKTVVQSLLGEPNKKLSNAQNWRYGSKGSLSVNVSGDKCGRFYNFETGEKGGMIRLVMTELGVDFKGALKIAEGMLSTKSIAQDPISIRKTDPVNENLHSKTYEDKRDFLEKLIKKSKPIEGTIAEKYLKNRGIETTDRTGLRCLEHVKTGSGNASVQPFSAALLAISRDKNGEPSAVQMTYIDKNTGDKVTGLPVPKRTLGALNGATINLTPQAEKPNITFVAEGVETALSIRDSLRNDSKIQVLATLGKQNFDKIPLESTADKVVLVLDNDLKNPLKDPAILQAIERLNSFKKVVEIIIPEPINSKKTDYNDLAKSGNKRAISADVSAIIDRISDGSLNERVVRSNEKTLKEKQL